MDLPEDGLKTLPADDGQAITLRVTGHAGYTPGAITAASLAYFYDGIDLDRCRDAPGERPWVGVVDHAGASGQPVTLRVNSPTATATP